MPDGGTVSGERQPPTANERHSMHGRPAHDLGSAAAVGGGKDNLGAPHAFLWRVAIRNDHLKPEAICSRDVDDNSCSHNERLNCTTSSALQPI